MKNYLLILFALSISLASVAQSFTFEDAAVPSSWVSSASGSLSLSSEHYKEGVQSLCWSTTGTTTLTTTFTSFIASTGNSAYMQIYSSSITNDTLKVDFMFNTLVKKTAIFLCNYKGWHEFNRAYTEYASTLSSSINTVRFTLKPTTSATRKIYFDNVDFNHITDASRIVGSHWILDKSYFNSTADTSFLSLYSNPVDLPLTTPTSQEITDLNTLKTTLKRTPTAGTSADLSAAISYVNSLNIVRNADGSVHGNVIDCSDAALTVAFMTDIANKVEFLAAAALTNPTTKILFQNFVDHLLDQGISEGCNFGTLSNDYTGSRNVPIPWLDATPVYTTDEKAEVTKMIKWMTSYGNIYYPPNKYLSKLVSDVIYLYTPYMFTIALNQADDATSVRELKAIKRYLERSSEYAPGGNDILKPDGTGFHHGTHYLGYMYAYKTWEQYMNYLKGTQFKISAAPYQRFKKAVISEFITGTLDTGDSRYHANSLCGRGPSNTQLSFTYTYFRNLVSVGTDILGSQDNELASAYNYFYQTNYFSAPTVSYDGFYQFNYSPMGVYRKSNWVATMRCQTATLKGSEVFDNANRFGRYQSNGSLEVMYNGTLASNGYPSSTTTTGGWDWNIVPGATVVQYTSWQEMMPFQSLLGRFDQLALTKNFSGALSFKDCGMFACDYDQIDSWGGHVAYTATNLTFKKSMFAFDNMIISIGSGISSPGTYSSTMTTSTNLFQCLNPASIGNVTLNGTTLTSPYTSTITTTNDNWLITPQGTGYFIPKGNDNLEIRFQNQTTPDQSGADYAAPVTTVMAAKAYLNHGVKPSNKTYSFVVVPATTSSAMQTLATQLANGGGSIYQILSQSSAYHALLYKPLNITAYSFFSAASNLTFGVVKSTTSPHLLMDKYDATLNRHSFAISDPNLHPISDPVYGWIATSSQTTLTLNGSWQPITPVSGVVFSTPTNGVTQVTVTMYNGEPIYFGAMPLINVATFNPVADQNWVTFKNINDLLKIDFPEGNNSKITIRISDLKGRDIINRTINSVSSSLELPIDALKQGFYLCTVFNLQKNQTFKFVK